MRCAIYARVSTRREEQQNSLDNQLFLAKSIAKDYGFTIVGEYIDNGISGKGFKNRSEIQRLITDAKAKKFEVVIAKSVARLGRNLVNSRLTADQFEKANIRLILPEDSYDSLTSQSKLLFSIKAMLAEEEIQKQSERVKHGLYASAKQGRYKASLPPFGYKINPTTRSLEIDNDIAHIVQEIFRLYLHSNWGVFKISNYLMKKGVPTPRTVSGASNAGTKWHQNTIKSILNNPVYIGHLVHHKNETTGVLSDTESYYIRKEVDPDQRIVIEDAHPAIINESDFLSVQKLMKKKGDGKYNGKESLFAHIAQCGTCGSGMHFKHDRRNGAYVCGGYVKYTSSYCSSHIIEQQVLLSSVKEDLRALIQENNDQSKLYKLADKRANGVSSDIAKQLKSVQREITNAENRFDSLLTLHAKGSISNEQFDIQNKKIILQQKELTNRKLELESSLEQNKQSTDQIKAFKIEVERFLNLDIDNQEVFKQMLLRLINKIEVHEDRIKIHYNISKPI